MNKIKLIARDFDGVTLVTQAPTFRLVEGWDEAELEGPAGILPAGLWGKVPAGDPYLLHACLLTTHPIDVQSVVEVRSGAPTQVRAQYMPSADNTRITLVRPSDQIRVFTPPQGLVKLELLVESIGGVNELGSRLHQWATAQAQAQSAGVRVANLTANATLAAWLGLLHIVYDSVNAGSITLPPRAVVPLDATLTISRKGAGVPTLIAAGGDTFAGGLANQTVTRSGIVMNNGTEWTWAGA